MDSLELQEAIAEKQALIANLIAKASPGYQSVIRKVEREIEEAKKALMEEAHKIASTGISSIDPLSTANAA